MLRILHVIGSMGSGGAEAFLMNLYRNIDRSQFQFDFVVHTDKEAFYDNEILALGGKIYRTKKYNVGNYFSYRKFWDTFFQAHPEYPIVHGHIGSSAAIYLSIAKRYGRIAVVHSHSTGDTRLSYRNLAFLAMNYPVRYIADYFFACSRQAGLNRFGSRAVQSGRFCVLLNGIDPQRYQYNAKGREAVRQNHGVTGNTIVLGHVGRFTYAKNHPFLIQVFKAFHKRVPDSKLWLVGAGEDEQKVRELVEQSNLKDSVIFMGETREVEKFLQAMDLFVFPSLWDGLGIALVEAQAARLSCLVSEAIQDEADIGAGLLHKMNLNDDYEKWVEKALELLKRGERKDTLQCVVNAGFDIKTTAAFLCSLYLKWAKQAGYEI